jgi:NitT/TauT family transport system substrate-binding protein
MTKTLLKDKFTRRRLLTYAGAGAVVAGAPAIVSNRVLGMSHKGMTKVVLADGPFISKGAPMIALEKGYFKKMGLDVSYKWFMDGSLIVAPMIAGEVDLGTLTPSAGMFNAIARGAKIHMFLDGGTDLERKHSYPVAMVAQKHWDAGVKTPKDLKKIAGLKAHLSAKGSINEFCQDRTWMAGGVDPTKVQTEYGLPQPALMKLMMKGGVNFCNFAYHFGFILQNAKKAQMLSLAYDVAPGNVISCYSYTEQKFASVGREVFVRFAMAYLQAAKEFNAAADTKPPPGDIMDILTKHTLFKGAKGRGLLTAIHPHWAQLQADGQPHKPGLAMMQDHWVDVRKYVKQKISIDKLVDSSIAAEAAVRLKKENPFKT